jgi:hypothetical protein
MDMAQGANFRSHTLGLDLSNEMRLGARDTLTLGGSIAFASYSHAFPTRTDQTYSLRLSWIRTLTRNVSLVGDAEYVTNSSGVDTYTYTKPSISLGVSYTL